MIPNIGVEVYALLQSTFPGTPDANAGMAVQLVLTDQRRGAEFPAINLDPDILTTYGDYTIAAGLPISVSLDAQQKCTEWLDGLAKLTNTAIVCSAALVSSSPMAIWRSPAMVRPGRPT